MLKNIHCLAANYYDQNGLLINASKRYRKARKLRKLNRVSSEPALTGAQINEDKEIDSAEQVAVQDSSVQQQRNRDMYRVLDGSVLVAIGGPLTQAHFVRNSYCIQASSQKKL